MGSPQMWFESNGEVKVRYPMGFRQAVKAQDFESCIGSSKLPTPAQGC